MPDEPQLTPPADPVAAEESAYIAIVSEYRCLRKAGASIVAAAALTAAQRVFINQASES